jgi:hypothetical protein
MQPSSRSFEESMEEIVNGSTTSPAVFVGGPIQYALDGPGDVFDRELRSTIEMVLGEISSMGFVVFSAHLIERFGDLTPSFDPHDVARRDFTWMKQCNLFIPILPCKASGELYRTDGTHIEIGWASALSKPILLLTGGSPPGDPYSHLIRGLSSVGVVKSFDLRTLPSERDAFRSLVSSSIRPAPCRLFVRSD